MINHLQSELPMVVRRIYLDKAEYLQNVGAHFGYPTSIYRQCDALTPAIEDASTRCPS